MVLERRPFSCTRLYIALGADPKNIVMCDSKGVIRKDNPSLDALKAEFATDRDLHTLERSHEGFRCLYRTF